MPRNIFAGTFIFQLMCKIPTQTVFIDYDSLRVLCQQSVICLFKPCGPFSGWKYLSKTPQRPGMWSNVTV